MKQKIYSVVFVAVFLSVVFLVPIYWVFIENNQISNSAVEKRLLEQIPVLKYKDFKKAVRNVLQGNIDAAINNYFNRFINRSYQKRVEVALSDRFPSRLSLIMASRWIDRQVIGIAYLGLDDPAIPTDTQNSIMVLSDKSRLIKVPNLFGVSEKKEIDEAILNYQNLISQFPNLNFNVFYIQHLEDTVYHPMIPYFKNADKGRSIQYFEDNLPIGLNLGKFTFNSYDDKINMFFKTDHHWNIRGACQGYGLIYPMLAENFPEISPKLDCDQYMVIPGLKFLGTYASKSLFPIKPEEIEISTVDLPPHSIIMDGAEIEYTKLNEYLSGKFSRNPFANHFGNVFGFINKSIEYYFPGSPPRNLLIIGSSYRTPIMPFIASHYRRTYVIDLRNEEKFSLGGFIAEHPVDDVLILGENSVIFQENQWQLYP